MRPAGCGPGRGPPLLQLGPAQVRCELPAAVPDRSAVLGGVAGQGDRVPGDLTRDCLTLNRLRTSTPAWSRRAKNSCSLPAAAAAVVTCRRSVILGASSRPRRAAFSFSARAGRRAAVRSAGAVERSPYRCSAARQAARTLYRPRTGWACRRPGGPASRRDECDHRRAARRSSGRPRLPGRRATARCGASPRARWPPIRHRTASGRRERRASSSARPAAGSPARPERPAAASAARSAWRSPACRPAAAQVRGWRDDASPATIWGSVCSSWRPGPNR